jgi:hypothetical protein
MTMRQKPERAPASAHETAEGLTAAGVMSKQTMREFDELCPRQDKRKTAS